MVLAPNLHSGGGEVERLAGGSVDHLRADFRPASRIPEFKPRPAPLIEEPLVPVVPHGCQNAPQGSALLRQHILVPWWPVLVAVPLNQALVLEPSETLGKHSPADSERVFELIEPPTTEQEVAQDQGRPPVAQQI